MFDWILSSLLPRKNLKTEPLVETETHYTTGSHTLYIIIPPWRGKLDYFQRLRNKIRKEGNSFIEYQFASGILSPDIENTRDLFIKIRNKIVNEIKSLNSQYKFSEIEVIGVSLGCVEALMIANANPYVNKITLVVPGNSLASSVWYGLRTRYIKGIIEAKGTTLDVLEKEWSILAPENNIDSLRGKKINVWLSKNDKVIPYYLGARLVDRMKSMGLNPTVKINERLGHYGTVLKFYLFPAT
ncbi:MAG: hypothetical protein AAB884_02555 [Patescibacteria group bacterium]